MPDQILHRSQRHMPAGEDCSAELYQQTVSLHNYLDDLAIKQGIDEPDEAGSANPLISLDGLFVPESPQLVSQLGSMLEGIRISTAEAQSRLASLETVSDSDQSQTKSLERQLRYLAARYLTQSLLVPENAGLYTAKTEGERWKNATNDLKRQVDSVPSVANALAENDIPCYDATYRFFDKLRYETPDGIVEAYLGRDGIFAYIGRLGQLAARGDNEPDLNLYPADRNQIPAAQPRYIAYSSGVRMIGNSNPLKQRYVAQQFRPSEIVHCFDTGYRGTAPYDLLGALGVPFRKRKHYTHLLEERLDGIKTWHTLQLPNMPHNRSVDAMEAYPKNENEAFELYDTGDTVKYLANTALPAGQFNYMTRRHMLYRHYLQSERERISASPTV